MSIKIKIYNQKAETVAEHELSEKVFGVKIKHDLVHQVTLAQMNNQRQVLSDTLDRAEVRGGGKKPWKQKGTGRARAGSNRSPLWRGGGVVFGPTSERNYKQKINLKMKRKALCMALSDKAESLSIAVIEKIDMGGYKTKDFETILKGLEKNVWNTDDKDNKFRRSLLLIHDTNDKKLIYSGRNLSGVSIINLDNINILDLLKYRKLVMTLGALEKIEEKYSK
jgi:large subunit ribosomal protein L4